MSGTKVLPTTQVLTLEVLVGHHQGLTSTQDQSERLKIGTESDNCGLALPACASVGILGIHGDVAFKDGSWVYTVLAGESSVDDVKTTPGQEYPIKSGTVLTLGDGIEIKVTIGNGVTDKNNMEPSLTPASAKSDLSQRPVALRRFTTLEIQLPGGGKSGFKCDLNNHPHCSVNKITPGSAAAQSGLQVSDVIHKVAGKTVPDEELFWMKAINKFISSNRAGGKTISITIRRPPSYKDITDNLRYDVNTNLTKVREKFGAESNEYKKSKTQAVIETNKLEEMAKSTAQHWPDEPFVRFPYNPTSDLMANEWTYQRVIQKKDYILDGPFFGLYGNSLRDGVPKKKPKIPRKNRTKEISVGKEEMKSLKFGLKSKWQPRHCYVKSCGSELEKLGMKPGMLVRAVDMVRCPPSGGPNQDGNAQDMVEALLREGVMLPEADKSVVISVESVGFTRYCIDGCCCLFPLTFCCELCCAQELLASQMQVLDDFLCCCNCFCNTMEEDFQCCHCQRQWCCTADCVLGTVSTVLTPVLCGLLVARIPCAMKLLFKSPTTRYILGKLNCC
jgi:hypothetical protein